MIGRWLDGLPDDARDRVIEAKRWCTGCFWDDHGGRCLVGHASDHGPEKDVHAAIVRFELWDKTDWGALFDRFDRLMARVGEERAVRWIKLRAAKPNRITVSTPATIAGD